MFVYMNDILIFSKFKEKYVQHEQQVLQRLLENQLFAKVEKCEFHIPKELFLGFIINAENVQTDPAKTVADWPTPSTRMELQRFLGFASFYQHFIRNYSLVAAHLTTLTSQKIHFRWLKMHSVI